MRKPITFQKVETGAQFLALQSFAATFNHVIDDKTITPLIVASRGNQPFAYFSIAQFPVVFPCFHPQHTSSRDFIEMIEQVRAWRWLSSLGHERFPQGVVLTAFDSDPVVKKELIEKMGFRSTGCTLWESYPGIEEAFKPC